MPHQTKKGSKVATEIKAEQTELPAQFNLCCADDFDMKISAAEETDDGKKNRTFSMVAYTGGEMRVSGFWYPVVVELSGLKLKQRKPIFLQHESHDIDYLLGQSRKVEVEDNKLIASGEILGKSDVANKVLALADAGYQWQASIGAGVEKYRFVKENESMLVNGKTVTGPKYVITKSSLGEISFVMLGADENTSARIAANLIQDKENKMPKKKIDLEAEAGDTDVTAEAEAAAVQAKADAEVKAKADAEAKADGITELRAKHATEIKRIGAISLVCNGEHPTIEAKAIEEGWTEDKTELAVLRASRPSAPAGHVDNTSMSPAILEAAVMMAGGVDGNGLLAKYGAEVVESADKIFKARIGLQQLLMEAARVNGYSGRYFGDNPEKMLRAAFSTNSLSGILSNIANKFLLDGFMNTEQTWREISAIRNVRDFKTVTSYRMSGGFEFLQVGPDGELKHAELGETAYTNKAETYGRMFGITRTQMINDDLGAITAVPQRIGRGGGLKLNSVFWTEFMDNSSFYTSGRGNYASGAGSALDIDAMTAAELLFLDQTDTDGYPLGIEPKLLLTPNSLSVTAKKYAHDTELKGDTDDSKYNPHAGKFTPIKSSYLGNSAITGYSILSWYLLAAAADLAVIETCFLNGVQNPTVEQATANFNTLGVEFRGFFDFGCSKQEYRGGVKNAGS